jgi:hypothetical protein
MIFFLREINDYIYLLSRGSLSNLSYIPKVFFLPSSTSSFYSLSPSLSSPLLFLFSCLLYKYIFKDVNIKDKDKSYTPLDSPLKLDPN